MKTASIDKSIIKLAIQLRMCRLAACMSNIIGPVIHAVLHRKLK